MPLAVPIALAQFWLFAFLSLLFFAFIFRAMIRRPKESRASLEPKSRIGIVVQSLGIAVAGFGPAHPVLRWSTPAAIAAYLVIVVLMGGAVALFASSSTALGKNWSLEARILEDHELVRSGPYAYIRHPIYLAMLLFLLGLAVALGHYVQLAVAIPLFLMGTKMRMDAEDRLLRTQFGEAHELYAREVPALIPKIV